MPLTKSAQRVTAVGAGIVFLILLLALALAVPDPTPFQYTVFRIVLALAAAAFAATIPGFLEVIISGIARATGAIAVFLIVFFFSPAKIVTGGPAGSLGGGSISTATSLGIPSGMTLSEVVSQIEKNADVTIGYGNCPAEKLSARVNPGTVTGDNIEMLVRNLLYRVRADFRYDVEVIQEGVRYDIICS